MFTQPWRREPSVWRLCYTRESVSLLIEGAQGIDGGFGRTVRRFICSDCNFARVIYMIALPARSAQLPFIRVRVRIVGKKNTVSRSRDRWNGNGQGKVIFGGAVNLLDLVGDLH